MCELINKIYTTYGFQNYSKNFCASCLVCGKQNAQGRLRSRPGKMPSAQYFIELNKCENKKYCLVIIDLYSKWIEVILTVRNDVIAKLSELLSLKMKYHCCYHPQSAGLVGRANGTIKAKLRKAMQERRKGWVTCLKADMLSLHIQPHM